MIGTDDPGVSLTDLAAQWEAAAGPCGLTADEILKVWTEPARAVFRPGAPDLEERLERGARTFLANRDSG